MHILFVCNEYPPAPGGGIGVFTCLLAEGLAGRRIAVTVAGMYSGIEAESREERNGVTVVRLPLMGAGRLSPVLNRVRFHRWVRNYISSHKVDIVEYPDFQTMYLGNHSRPTVLRLHGSNTYYAYHGQFGNSLTNAFIEKRAIRKAGHLVGVSRYVLDSTLSVINKPVAGRTSVIHNCCDDRIFKPMNASGRSNIILYFGTLSRIKGVFTLAEAANSALLELPDAELHLVGRDAGEGGRSASETIAAMLDKRVAGRVRMPGPVSNELLPGKINGARLCVFPSKAEAFGLTVIEAMACGRPVIASLSGAHPEIITDGQDGILVDPNDAAGLSRAIVRLYRDEALRNTLGANALGTVRRRFSATVGLDSNIEFYRRIASS